MTILPKGFKAAGIHAGIKKDKNKKDLAMIYCEKKCNSAALFTTNKVKAAPILLSMEHIKDGQAQAVIVNSGNANACTANGMEVAQKMCSLTADSLGINPQDVIVASTGVIGQELTIDDSQFGNVAKQLSEDGFCEAAQAIMTTDTFMKECSVEFELGRISAIAKGSGMINPNMATMLCFITTDVAISQPLLERALREINEKTFNMVSVDGDTSTNDIVCIMASGLSGNNEITQEDKEYELFYSMLYSVMEDLAKKMAKDGEGATKLIECAVSGAKDEVTARSVAKSVISSSLVKSALGAADANWGRILCAIGYADGEFDINKVEVKLGDIAVCKNGMGVDFSEEQASKYLSNDEIIIEINMGSGDYSASAWGCDLTEEYVRINADYRT